MSRILIRELGSQPPSSALHLHSVVVYVGQGAGASDNGRYAIRDLESDSSLAWQYQVIHLWRMEAEELLALQSPAFLALLGQTRIQDPKRILPQVLARIGQIADEMRRSRLLTALTSLISDEEVLKMAEQLIESTELLMDTPFLRRIRSQGRQEGRLETLVQNTLTAIRLRFNPPILAYERVAQRIHAINDLNRLEPIYEAAIQAENLDAFMTSLPAEEALN